MKRIAVSVACLVVAALAAGPVRAQQAPTTVPTDLAQFDQYVAVLERYLSLVREFQSLAADPAASGVAAVIGARSIVEQQGPSAAINFFNDVLQDTTDPTVQRAIRLQLVELHKAAGQNEEALSILRDLMTTPK